MKKVCGIFMAICILLLAVSGCGSRTTPVEDFVFEIDNGEITICGYIGTDRELVIPSEIAERPVTKIGARAFAGYDLTKIKLPDTLKEIGEGAFYECVFLTSIDIPKNVSTIGDGAFHSCTALEKINLPQDLEYLGENAFGCCDMILKNQNDTYPIKAIEQKYAESGTLEYEGVTTYKYSYNNDGKATAMTTIKQDGYEYITEYQYNEQGKIVSITFETSVTTREYDEKGRLLNDCSYLNGVLMGSSWYVYEAWNLLYIQGNNGERDEVTCDAYGRIIERLSYDSNGELDAIYRTTYDDDGKLVESTVKYCGSLALLGSRSIQYIYE